MEEVPADNPTVEAAFDEALTQITRDCDRLFTAEEGRGRYVDMTTLFAEFINLKKAT